MNIRQRIILLILLTFLALSSIGAFAVLQSSGNATEVRSVTEGVVPSAMHSVELKGQLKDVQMAAMSMVAAVDEQAITQTREELAQKKETLQKALEQQYASANSGAQRGLVREAQDSLKNYFAAIDDTANFKLKGMKDMAEANLAATVEQYLREQSALLDTLQIEKRRSKDEAIEDMNRHLTATTTTLGVATVLAVLLLAGIGRVLYRQVVHPIKDMELKMTEIAVSQDYTQRLPVKRHDEVGGSITAFNHMIEKIQTSSELVRQKTADIHAMLHNVPLGILTIEQDQRVHPEYSVHLEQILGTQEIAARPFQQLIFDGVALGEDQRAQIDAAVGACLGEDAMNFDFNAHLLPHEIEKTLPDGQTRILDLIWSPISDAHGVTERLLLCVRDVTELRALARAADAQKHELALIGEILAVPAERFQAFVASSTQLLAQSEQALQAAPGLDETARQGLLGLLLRHLHTLKGNARTYGLLQLTEALHQSEQRCEALRQAPTQRPWEAAPLAQELDRVRTALQEYIGLDRDKLGRGRQAGTTAAAGADASAAQALLEQALQRLESLVPGDADASAQLARDIRQGLASQGAESVQQQLADLIASLPSLAQELDKEVPRLVFDDHGLKLRPQAGELLRHVFTHLYRNAIDHGIEPILERVAAGKPVAGTISLALTRQGQTLSLVLRDDGRGLALQRILAKAREQGRIGPQDSPDAAAIAQLVFAPGFSTASRVSEVSGRGVGMDAVKAFVEEAGGHIELRLLAPATGHEAYLAFETRIELPVSLLAAEPAADLGALPAPAAASPSALPPATAGAYPTHHRVA